MYKSFSMELAGRTLTVDVGRVAKQANGAAFMRKTVPPPECRTKHMQFFSFCRSFSAFCTSPVFANGTTISAV